MNSDFDLVIVEQGEKLIAIQLPLSLSHSVHEDKALRFKGIDYSGLTPFADWLAIVDSSSTMVGMAIVDLIRSDIAGARLFKAKNVSKVADEFHILFAEANNPQVDGWPLLTVYALKSGPDDYILYIPDFYSVQQKISLADDFTFELLQK